MNKYSEQDLALLKWAFDLPQWVHILRVSEDCSTLHWVAPPPSSVYYKDYINYMENNG